MYSVGKIFGKNRGNIFGVVLAASMLGSGVTWAAEESTSPIQLGAFVDTYYSFNFNKPRQVTAPNAASVTAATLPSANNTYRYYDSYHNQMTLSLVELTIAAKYKEVSLLTDLDFGTFADLNAAVSSSSGASSDEVSKHVGQAVISYKPEGSRFFLEAGKMYTHVGLETVKSKDNFNYSRTVLFSFGMPFWHTGLRLGYDVVPEKIQTSFYVYNGWNSLYDSNQSKTLGGQVKYTPSSLVSIVYNVIAGPERSESNRDWKVVNEVNTTWNLASDLTLATDALYGYEKNAQVGASRTTARWYGGLVALKYQITEKSYVSPRYEFYRDQQGFTLAGPPQTVQTGTLTYGRFLAKGLEARAEARLDRASQKSFANGAGARKNTQSTALAALLFSL